ncbi:hypothetical protein [Streptomyces indicus]|uniref:Uncharacterized protein n=1 Tax=Streptomyces indicus TaxID=417292 RepID=A0A1G8T2W1_9ACTN|nr:hypothetical protein [Streptomyces indicus]SDJ35878.1 hypothetical protein SAMN05421806_10124 [Streptomyces indicus]
MPPPAHEHRPSDEELARLAVEALDVLADELAARLTYSPDRDCHTEVHPQALRRLRILSHLQKAVKELQYGAARDAATAGAGYPQIGAAAQLSRQGARRRWPGLPTGPARPHPLLAPRSNES